MKDRTTNYQREGDMAKGKRLVAEVTMPHGKKTTIDITTDKKNYGYDLAKLKEIYGDKNVKEQR